jgi:hypothetical protein
LAVEKERSKEGKVALCQRADSDQTEIGTELLTRAAVAGRAELLMGTEGAISVSLPSGSTRLGAFTVSVPAGAKDGTKRTSAGIPAKPGAGYDRLSPHQTFAGAQLAGW